MCTFERAHLERYRVERDSESREIEQPEGKCVHIRESKTREIPHLESECVHIRNSTPREMPNLER